MTHFSYSADGQVVREFLSSDAFVRGLRGPVGSGKTVACCVGEVFRRALLQEPSPIDGKRKTRWAIIRNTQPELKTTSIKTWLDWVPEREYGKFNWSPPFTHHIKRGPLDCEVLFLALDTPDDVKKLLSLELTGAFINEAREIPKAIVDGATMRVGRYPSIRDGGPTWSGVVMDTNSPDEDHWWAIMSGDCLAPDWMTPSEVKQLVKPEDWEFFSQPGAMLPKRDSDGVITGWELNPARENQDALPKQYYTRMIAGKTNNWISVYVGNQYGTLADGRPVYPEFDLAIHVAKDELEFIPGVKVFVGIDFGLTPAAIIGQNFRGGWRVLKEIVCQDTSTAELVEELRSSLAFYGNDFSFWGDPAGDQRAQTDKDTSFKILRGQGIMAQPAPSNDVALRLEAVKTCLTTLRDGKPRLQISPSCRTLIKGFEAGYQYRRLQITGMEKYETTPDKNRFSHPHDALQYMLLGGGEARQLLRAKNPAKVTTTQRKWDTFNRKPRLKPSGFGIQRR